MPSVHQLTCPHPKTAFALGRPKRPSLSLNGSLAVNVYIAVIAVAGCLAVYESLLSCRIGNWPGFLLYIAVSVFASGFKVRLPGITCTVSAGFLPVLIGIVCLSTAEALIAAFSAVLIQCVWHAKKLSAIKILFNTTSIAVAVRLAAAVYHSPWLGSRDFEFALRLLILGGVYFIANTWPVAGVVALTEKKSVWSVWSGSYRWSLPYYLIGAAAAGLFASAKDHFGWETALLLIPIGALVYRACSLQIGRVEDATEHAAALEEKNRELQEALTAAQEASEIKSRFLATFSHELRTPLNGIIGLSQLLHDDAFGPVSQEQRESLADILQCSTHLLSLISDILDLTKVELGSIQFKYEDVRLGALMDETVKSVAAVAAPKQILVAMHAGQGVELVKADPVRLRQIILNYLSNALKFTPAGGSVKVSAFAVSDAQFCVEVRDTGVGIRPEDLSRLFREFGQLGPANRPQNGSGLGLAITKRIVEAQGGQVGVESTLGSGSRFWAILPRGGAGCQPEVPQS